MYLIDTNVISEARRGTAAAIDWMRSVDAEAVHLSVITLGEITRGIALKRRSDPRSASHIAEWLLELRHHYGSRVPPVTDRVAVEWGRIAAIRPRGDADGLIAATALVHQMVLVTRNVADFEDTGAVIVNPWD